MLARISGNPFQTSTEIICDNLLKYSLYSINGKMLENGNAQGYTVIGTNLTAGVYILKLKDEKNDEMQVIKLVKMQSL